MMRSCIVYFLFLIALCLMPQAEASEKLDVYSSPEYVRLSERYTDVCKQNEQLRIELKSLKEIKVEAVISDADRKLLHQAVDNQCKGLQYCKYTIVILVSIVLLLFLRLLFRRKKK